MTRDEFAEEVRRRLCDEDAHDHLFAWEIAADLFAEVMRCKSCKGVGKWSELELGIMRGYACGACSGTGSRLR